MGCVITAPHVLLLYVQIVMISILQVRCLQWSWPMHRPCMSGSHACPQWDGCQLFSFHLPCMWCSSSLPLHALSSSHTQQDQGQLPVAAAVCLQPVFDALG